jgi:NDP-sugar pyrophosphorylase family protein
MFTGVHVIEPELTEFLPPGPSNIVDAYVRALEAERPLWGYTMEGFWMDLGTPERLREAEAALARGALRPG